MPLFQILAVAFFAAVFFYKFAIKIFRKEYQGPTKYAAPWSVMVAVLFLATFCVAPSVVRGLAEAPLHAILPDLDAEYAANTATQERESQKEESDDGEDADNGGSDSPENTEDETPANKVVEPKEELRNPDEIQLVERERNDANAPTEFEIAIDADDKSDATEVGANDQSKIAIQHPMSRLLIRSHKTKYFNLVVALFFAAVVLVAPVVEEFVFRVVIQGFFETRAGFGRRRDDAAHAASVETCERGDVKMRAFLVCFSQATLFAMLHAGAPESEGLYTPMNPLLEGLIVSIVSSIILFGVGILVLRRLGAKSGDLGLGEDFSLKRGRKAPTCMRLTQEWLRGVYLQIYATPVVFLVEKYAEALFPGAIVAPIPIFVFALYEGYVYFRTRSLPTVVGMHMTLNFISFTILYYGVLLDQF